MLGNYTSVHMGFDTIHIPRSKPTKSREKSLSVTYKSVTLTWCINIFFLQLHLIARCPFPEWRCIWGSASTGDLPIKSEWSTRLLPIKMWLRYDGNITNCIIGFWIFLVALSVLSSMELFFAAVHAHKIPPISPIITCFVASLVIHVDHFPGDDIYLFSSHWLLLHSWT